MNIVPIAFCFDEKMELAAGVCLTSLLVNALPETFYDIYILHSDRCSFTDSKINELVTIYKNCNITYRQVGCTFDTAFEVRGISIATYYRLMIPDVIPEYDKIIYSDVDVIFRDDLFNIFNNTDLTNSFVGGVVEASYFRKKHQEYIERLNLSWQGYIYAGNLIMNSRKIREEGLVELFINQALSHKYLYQDMDVLNIVCKGYVARMPPSFCLSTDITEYAANNLKQSLYSEEELQVAFHNGIVHYNGPKPWSGPCLNFDIWWEYYRKSIFFDSTFYYKFFKNQETANDRLSLLKRFKLLVRYFKPRKVLMK